MNRILNEIKEIIKHNINEFEIDKRDKEIFMEKRKV